MMLIDVSYQYIDQSDLRIGTRRARVGEIGGSQLASAVTLTLFLSLFPVLLVATAVVGFLASGDSDLTGEGVELLFRAGIGLLQEAAGLGNEIVDEGVDAVGRNPSGGVTTESLWLIHTVCSTGRSENNTEPGPSTARSVLPNSAMPVLATSPPSVCAMSCWP